jgi:signal transduction histidine kinase
MLAIVGVSAIAVYEFSRHSLYEQLDERLKVLARAAAHELASLKTQPKSRMIDRDGDRALDQRASLDNDGDLDLPWQRLRERDQGVEWFNAQGKLLANTGSLVTQSPIHRGAKTLQHGKIRAFTLEVYGQDRRQSKLEGYVRTTETTAEVEAVLLRLRWGLGVGGAIVLGLTGLGGIWLTRQSLKPIEQSFQQLKQFTADVSHELRGPLAAIKTTIEVMQCYPERIHPQDVKKVMAIASATNQMTRLVENLLFLARMDTISEELPSQQGAVLSLSQLLEDVLRLLEPSAQAKDIELQSYVLAHINVKGEPDQLMRLFANIVENALQYTPRGGRVTLSMKPLDQTILVSVEDTGIGIAPEHLPFIFHRFWRANESRSPQDGGMGLGLAIAQAIAQRHHGVITVTSQLGVGSCFQIRLPMLRMKCS